MLSSYKTSTRFPTAYDEPPPPKLLPVLERLKAGYILWSDYYKIFEKTRRYTLGSKIDGLFIDLIEAMAAGSFLPKGDKEPYLRTAVRKLDTIKILLLIAWETNALDTKKYAALSALLDDTGKQLGGWYGQLKRNSPARAGEK